MLPHTQSHEHDIVIIVTIVIHPHVWSDCSSMTNGHIGYYSVCTRMQVSVLVKVLIIIIIINTPVFSLP